VTPHACACKALGNYAERSRPLLQFAESPRIPWYQLIEHPKVAETGAFVRSVSVAVNCNTGLMRELIYPSPLLRHTQPVQLSNNRAVCCDEVVLDLPVRNAWITLAEVGNHFRRTIGAIAARQKTACLNDLKR
jgi:hypothetical protein